MKKLLSLGTLALLLTIPQIATADKPSWSGTKNNPTQEQVKEHKSAMNIKNDDRKEIAKKTLLKKEQKEEKIKKEKKFKNK